MVRNVANLVPPCETGDGYHGTRAALEFAVRTLHVEYIIVLGHSQCGGIQAFLDNVEHSYAGEFITPWMEIAKDALRTDKLRACEQAAIQTSLQNLHTFPWMHEVVTQQRLELHGWYFDIAQGQLLIYNHMSKHFELAQAG